MSTWGDYLGGGRDFWNLYENPERVVLNDLRVSPAVGACVLVEVANAGAELVCKAALSEEGRDDGVLCLGIQIV